MYMYSAAKRLSDNAYPAACRAPCCNAANDADDVWAWWQLLTCGRVGVLQTVDADVDGAAAGATVGPGLGLPHGAGPALRQ